MASSSGRSSIVTFHHRLETLYNLRPRGNAYVSYLHPSAHCTMVWTSSKNLRAYQATSRQMIASQHKCAALQVSADRNHLNYTLVSASLICRIVLSSAR